MDATGFAVAIMAAGKGTRLKSKRPKVLHQVGGRALLLHVIAESGAWEKQGLEVDYDRHISSTEAHRAASRRFGNVTQLREQSREIAHLGTSLTRPPDALLPLCVPRARKP